jgi:hypothetical protein
MERWPKVRSWFSWGNTHLENEHRHVCKRQSALDREGGIDEVSRKALNSLDMLCQRMEVYCGSVLNVLSE